ncbi:hypothetical protein [Rhodanobacter sp. BL-MT-08]
MPIPKQFRKPQAGPERAPILTALERACEIHSMLDAVLGAACATKALFDTAADLTVDFDTIEPMLVAGSAISDNQSTQLCAVMNALNGLEMQLQLQGAKA